MDREERQMYAKCGQVLGSLLGIVSGVGIGAYQVYKGTDDALPGIIAGFVGGQLFGYTLAIGANVVTRVKDNDWNDVRERMSIRTRWRNWRNIDDDL